MSLFDINLVEKKMISSLDNLTTNFQGIRTGRASTGLVDNIIVDAYGQNMKLKDLATVSVPEARTIKINVWDNNMIALIEKAILNSSLDLNPLTEGQVIRINLPELTTERRGELAKNIRSLAEEAKISLRNVRQDAMNLLKKAGSEENIPEDEKEFYRDEIKRMKEERNALILSHNYVPSDIQELSDVVGDSLFLAQQGADSDADYLIEATVLFMNQMLAALKKPHQKVLAPNLGALCSLAAHADVSKIKRWNPRAPLFPGRCRVIKACKR